MDSSLLISALNAFDDNYKSAIYKVLSRLFNLRGETLNEIILAAMEESPETWSLFSEQLCFAITCSGRFINHECDCHTTAVGAYYNGTIFAGIYLPIPFDDNMCIIHWMFNNNTFSIIPRNECFDLTSDMTGNTKSIRAGIEHNHQVKLQDWEDCRLVGNVRRNLNILKQLKSE